MICIILSKTDNSCYFFPHLKDSDAYQTALIANTWIDITHLTGNHRVKILKNIPKHRSSNPISVKVFNHYVSDVLYNLSHLEPCH